MRFAPSTGWSSKSALYFLAALVAAALLLFVLLTNSDNASAQLAATATPTPTPTSSPIGHTPTPTPFAVASPQSDDVFTDSVDAGIHIIDGLIDAEQREHSETTFPQNGAAPSADQTSGPIWSFPDDMSQDLRDKYRAAFDVMHQLSEQRFGVSVNIAKLNVEVVNALDWACGVAYSRDAEGRQTIVVVHSCRSSSGTGEVTEIASAVMAHEYFHALHFELENDAITNRISWLYEGGSEHFKNIYLHHIGAINYIDIRDYLNSLTPSVRANIIQGYQSYPPLRTHGRGGRGSNISVIYEIGLLAVQYLLEQTGARAQTDFFRRSRDKTFEDIYGVSLDTFYTSFEAHLAAGLPLPGAPFIAPTATPTHGPTHTPTVTATPSPTHTPTATLTPGPTRTPAPEGCDNGVVVDDPANNHDLVKACVALLKAAPTLAAEPPLNWSADANIYDWEGVQIGGSPPSVLVLFLAGRNLTGSLPAELGSLSRLEILDFNANSLTGDIPPELGNLSNLEDLSIRYNRLTGDIPSELDNLSNLQWLHLNGNQLTGDIPSELGNLSNLIRLEVNNNSLTGEIPSELGRLYLEALRLDNNQLTGEIPSGLNDFSNLRELYISGNQFSGCLPVSLRGIQDNDLQETGLWFCNNNDVRDRVRELEGEMGTVQEQVEALLTQMGTMERLISMLIVRMDALEGALPAATPTATSPRGSTPIPIATPTAVTQ